MIGLKKYTKKSVERNPGSVACSSLLNAYGVLLQYDAQFWDEKEGEAEMNLEQFILKLEKAFEATRPYLHYFFESFISFLVQNGQQEKAEKSIFK